MGKTLDLASLERRFDAVPALSRTPRSIEELSGGLTNLNVKVTTPDGVFVARCFGQGELLGIDRQVEHLNTRAAAEAGVGAPVFDFREELDMLVIGYIDGVTYDNSTFAQAGVVSRVADACAQLHAGPRFVNEFDMFARQRNYLAIVERNGFALPEGYQRYADRFDQIRSALAVREHGTVPCNNDLLAANFVDDGTKLWVIDYEYSGNNDACFELGNISTECDLDLDQLEELVTAYYGRRLRSRIARARLQAHVSQYGWALWGAIQAATSPLDFDFTGWGTERYEKAVAGFTSDGFDELLEEVQRDD
ncbi:MAG TPA: phosphotransferase [Nocardioidaceae bacterium]|nr:phosphotransferase [Nocardioidaceae bacterium]